MGLTIHYRLRSSDRGAGHSRDLVHKLRQRALDLRFAEVGELIDLSGPECDYETCGPDSPHGWLLIQSAQHVERKAAGELRRFHVRPLHVIAFETLPGEGCEPANFGLCRYPSSVEFHGQKVRTGLTGWSWASFCKTQYASSPGCGGVENFLRCHLSVIALLDSARSLGILHDVSDESRYWERRDLESLAKGVGEWNAMIAGFAGRLKDQFGDAIVAPIMDFPDFEHLEAKGRPQETD